jgi:hypothetical protein
MHRRTLLRTAAPAAAAVVAAFAGCTAPGTATEATETRSLDVSDGTPIRIRNRNGAVDVDVHDGDDVELTVTKRNATGTGRFDEASVRTGTTDDGEYAVEVVYDTDAARSTVAVALELAVPAGTRIASVETDNGRVIVQGTTGDLSVRTGNGAIDARGIDGYVTLAAANGSIDATEVAGVDGIRTTNGSVDVEVRAIRGDTEIRSTNGTIDAALDPDLDVRVVAVTDVGSIDVEDLPLTGEGAPTRRVTGTLGDGGNELNIRTNNGGIDLTALEAEE